MPNILNGKVQEFLAETIKDKAIGFVEGVKSIGAVDWKQDRDAFWDEVSYSKTGQRFLEALSSLDVENHNNRQLQRQLRERYLGKGSGEEERSANGNRLFFGLEVDDNNTIVQEGVLKGVRVKQNEYELVFEKDGVEVGTVGLQREIKYRISDWTKGEQAKIRKTDARFSGLSDEEWELERKKERRFNRVLENKLANITKNITSPLSQQQKQEIMNKGRMGGLEYLDMAMQLNKMKDSLTNIATKIRTRQPLTDSENQTLLDYSWLISNIQLRGVGTVNRMFSNLLVDLSSNVRATVESFLPHLITDALLPVNLSKFAFEGLTAKAVGKGLAKYSGRVGLNTAGSYVVSLLTDKIPILNRLGVGSLEENRNEKYREKVLNFTDKGELFLNRDFSQKQENFIDKQVKVERLAEQFSEEVLDEPMALLGKVFDNMIFGRELEKLVSPGWLQKLYGGVKKFNSIPNSMGTTFDGIFTEHLEELVGMSVKYALGANDPDTTLHQEMLDYGKNFLPSTFNIIVAGGLFRASMNAVSGHSDNFKENSRSVSENILRRYLTEKTDLSEEEIERKMNIIGESAKDKLANKILDFEEKKSEDRYYEKLKELEERLTKERGEEEAKNQMAVLDVMVGSLARELGVSRYEIIEGYRQEFGEGEKVESLSNQLNQAGYKNNRTDVGEFVDYVNGKEYEENNKKTFQDFNIGNNENIRLTSDTIKHISDHTLTGEDYKNILNNINNIKEIKYNNKKNYYGSNNLILNIETPKGEAGIVLTVGNNNTYLTTAFYKTNLNLWERWFKNKDNKLLGADRQLNLGQDNLLSNIIINYKNNFVKKDNLGQNVKGSFIEGYRQEFKEGENKEKGELKQEEITLNKINKVIDGYKNNIHIREEFKTISNDLVETLKKYGFNLEGYSHSLDTQEIQHFLNNHGKKGKKLNKNSIPITEEDVRRIPFIIDNYDFIQLGRKSNTGLNSIRYIKTFKDGTTYYVEEIRTGIKQLASKTFWKERTALDKLQKLQTFSKGENPKGAGRSLEEIITIKNSKVNNLGQNVKGSFIEGYRQEFKEGEKVESLSNQLNQAGYRNSRTNIKDFVEYVIDNKEELKRKSKTYQEFNIDGIKVKLLDTNAIHSIEEHNLTSEDFENILNNFNIVDAKISNKYEKELNLLLKIKTASKNYAVVLKVGEKENNIIKTIFDENNKNEWNNWWNKKSSDVLTNIKNIDIEPLSLDKLILQIKNSKVNNLGQNVKGSFIDGYRQEFGESVEQLEKNRAEEEIKEFYQNNAEIKNNLNDLIKAEENNKFLKIRLPNIEKEQIEIIKNIGLNINEKTTRELNTEFIKHLKKKHWGIKEKQSDQIGLNEKDILSIPLILTKPDRITKGTDKNSVRYIKQLNNGSIYYVEEFLNNKNKLISKTMWKKRLQGENHNVSPINSSQEKLDMPAPQSNSNYKTFSQNVKGSFRFDNDYKEFVIKLFRDKADQSTLLHENMHFFEKTLEKYALLGYERAKFLYNEIKGAVGEVQDKMTVEKSEDLARGYEQYIREGKYKNEILKDVYDFFRKHLLRIYERAEDLNIDVNNPQMNEFFDKYIFNPTKYVNDSDWCYKLKSGGEKGEKENLEEELGDEIPYSKFLNETVEKVLTKEKKEEELIKEYLKDKIKDNQIKEAVEKIYNNENTEETIKNLRNDLEELGGTNDITLIWGNDKKGMQHIINKHGEETLYKVLNILKTGEIKEFKQKNKKVIIEKDKIRAVLSLDDNGKRKSWLLTGYDLNISPDDERQISANQSTMHLTPTFWRDKMGAGQDNYNSKNVNSQEEFKKVLKQGAEEEDLRKAIEEYEEKLKKENKTKEELEKAEEYIRIYKGYLLGEEVKSNDNALRSLARENAERRLKEINKEAEKQEGKEKERILKEENEKIREFNKEVDFQGEGEDLKRKEFENYEELAKFFEEKGEENTIKIEPLFKSWTDLKDLRNMAKEYYRINIQGTSIERDDIGKVFFTNLGLEKTISSSKGHPDIMQLLPYIKEVVKSGTLINEEQLAKRAKNKKLNGYIGIVNYVSIEEKKQQILALLQKREDGNYYYTSYLNLDKRKDVDPLNPNKEGAINTHKNYNNNNIKVNENFRNEIIDKEVKVLDKLTAKNKEYLREKQQQREENKTLMEKRYDVLREKVQEMRKLQELENKNFNNYNDIEKNLGEFGDLETKLKLMKYLKNGRGNEYIKNKIKEYKQKQLKADFQENIDDLLSSTIYINRRLGKEYGNVIYEDSGLFNKLKEINNYSRKRANQELEKLIKERKEGKNFDPQLEYDLKKELLYFKSDKEITLDSMERIIKHLGEVVEKAKEVLRELKRKNLGETIKERGELVKMILETKERNPNTRDAINDRGNWRSFLTMIGGRKLADKFDLVDNEMTMMANVKKKKDIIFNGIKDLFKGKEKDFFEEMNQTVGRINFLKGLEGSTGETNIIETKRPFDEIKQRIIRALEGLSNRGDAQEFIDELRTVQAMGEGSRNSNYKYKISVIDSEKILDAIKFLEEDREELIEEGEVEEIKKQIGRIEQKKFKDKLTGYDINGWNLMYYDLLKRNKATLNLLKRYYDKDSLKVLDELLAEQSSEFKQLEELLFKSVQDREELAPYYMAEFNKDMGLVENYFPRRSRGETEINTFEVLLKNNNDREKTISAIENRSRNAIPDLNNNPLVLALSHINQTEYVKNIAPKLKNIMNIINTEVKTVIEDKFDKQTLNTLDVFLNAFKQLNQRKFNTNVEQFVSAMIGNWSRSVTNTPSVFAKQVGSYILQAEGLEFGDLMKFHKNLLRGVKNFNKTKEFMLELSPYLKEIFKGNEYNELLELVRKGKDSKKSTIQIITDWLLKFRNNEKLNKFDLTKAGDFFSVVFGGYARYQTELEKGKSKEEALRIFERQTVSTQQEGKIISLQSARALKNQETLAGRLWELFMSQNMQIANKQFQRNLDLENGEISREEYWSKILVGNVLNAFMQTMMGLLIKSIYGKELDKTKVSVEFLTNLTCSFFMPSIYLGQAQTALRAILKVDKIFKQVKGWGDLGEVLIGLGSIVSATPVENFYNMLFKRKEEKNKNKKTVEKIKEQVGQSLKENILG